MSKRSSLNNQINGSHYKNKGIQPVEYCCANDLSFLEGIILELEQLEPYPVKEVDSVDVLNYLTQHGLRIY